MMLPSQGEPAVREPLLICSPSRSPAPGALATFLVPQRSESLSGGG